MKKLILVLPIILIAACTPKPEGKYACKGPYKFLTFDGDNVTVDMGFAKKLGTVVTRGDQVALTLDEKSLVLTSLSDDGKDGNLSVEATEYAVLDSPMVTCTSIGYAKENLDAFIETPDGIAFSKTPQGKKAIEAIRSLE